MFNAQTPTLPRASAPIFLLRSSLWQSRSLHFELLLGFRTDNTGGAKQQAN